MRKSRISVIAAVGAIVLGAGAVVRASISFVNVDDRITLVTDSNAVVTGGVLCTTDDELSVNVTILQNQGQESIAASGFVDGLICTGFPQAFAIPVEVIVPLFGEFKKGPASVIVGVSTFDGVNFDSQTIVLRGHISK
jgi:hypothetical protein